MKKNIKMGKKALLKFLMRSSTRIEANPDHQWSILKQKYLPEKVNTVTAFLEAIPCDQIAIIRQYLQGHKMTNADTNITNNCKSRY
uniref:Uncharacterized protein n=1 Tax=Rhizophora mucronata TaxID=61149 RepID=A0A2P2NPJ8_RHIMU